MAGAFDYKQPQRGGVPRPTGLLNGASAFKIMNSATPDLFSAGWLIAKTVTSGSTTAGVLKTVLSLSGTGVISFLAMGSADSTSRTHRLKVTLDGVVIFDATTAATANTTFVFSAIGCVVNTAASTHSAPNFEPLSFNTSLLIEYADSLSETGGAYLAYRYYPT